MEQVNPQQKGAKESIYLSDESGVGVSALPKDYQGAGGELGFGEGRERKRKNQII